jgi:PIN domain nuclease of toxin-antitoxin system
VSRFLLDTHVFIWQADDPDRIPVAIKDIMSDSDSSIVLSYASIWEMQIKASIGRLEMESDSVRQMAKNPG